MPDRLTGRKVKDGIIHEARDGSGRWVAECGRCPQTWVERSEDEARAELQGHVDWHKRREGGAHG